MTDEKSQEEKRPYQSSLPTPLARLEDVLSRGEAVILGGDPWERAAWLAEVERAEQEVRAARAAPAWVDLLRDPTFQPPGAGEVTASILAYQNATMNTSCACRGTIHRTCNNGSSGMPEATS